MPKTRFAAGQAVRVREGVASPEFPEVLLSGWSGTIEEVAARKTPPAYLIEWDGRTLEALPSGYSDRCEQQGLYFKMMWLSESDLEPRDG